jgi:hypothetical protein
MLDQTTGAVSVFHQFARDYAKRGLAVFPLQARSKAPALAGGFKNATTDQEQIDRWWGSEPYRYSNIGVATGLNSNIAVLDVDSKPDASEILADLEGEFGKLPDTACNLTGGHGMQFIFACTEGLPSRIGLRHGIDFKCAGGYIVVPPSVHPNGRTYHWDIIRAKQASGFAPLPLWLRVLVCKGKALHTDGPTSWRTIAASGVTEGNRNETIARFCGHLFRKDIDAEVVRELIHAWNHIKCRPPLGPTEIDRILHSIARAEIQRRVREEVGNGCN